MGEWQQARRRTVFYPRQEIKDAAAPLPALGSLWPGLATAAAAVGRGAAPCHLSQSPR